VLGKKVYLRLGMFMVTRDTSTNAQTREDVPADSVSHAQVAQISVEDQTFQAALNHIHDPRLRKAAEEIWPEFAAGVAYLRDR
jgi:hypothetical protein